MSTCYTIACRTCKERIEMAGFSNDAVANKAGEWARYKHFSHDITVINDITGWDDEFDRNYDMIMTYTEVES